MWCRFFEGNRVSRIRILQLPLCLVVIGVVFLSGSAHALAATVYVNSATGDDSTGDGTSGNPYRSFHKAYTSASSNDTIDATGTFTWTDSAESGDLSTSGYTFSKNVTISGHGPDQTVFQAASTDNSADRRVFTLPSAYTITLQDLAIRYGKITSGNGGCVLTSGVITLTRVEIYNCRATNGYGGAISAAAGTLTTTNSALYSNVVYYGGGGVHLGQSTAATSTLTNNTIYSNNVTASGGAFYGGGVYANGLGNIYLTNNTIAANNAGGTYGIGGGLLIYNASLHLYLSNNLIASNTASYYANTGDFYTYGGTIHNNGHNIIGRAESYGWIGVSDWTDSNADGVFALNGSATTGRVLFDSAAAVNSSPYKTKTWAVQSGSIAVNRGTTTSNGLISIPTADQRGATRTGATDIGAYEYNGALADSTGPVISSVASSTTATTATITWTTDESASSAINYGTSASYGTASTSASLVTNHSYTLSGLSSGTTYHFQIVVTDASSNTTTSSDYVFTTATPDVTAPTISSVASSTTTTTATITWSTNENASSTVRYGATSSYGSASTTPAYQTSQSITLTGLTSATTYHFRVESSDTSGNFASSSDYTFTTATVPDTTAPTASTTAPVGGTTVSDTVTLSANATDNTAVAGVSFYVDGVRVGVEDTSAPYAISWDSTATSSGTYTILSVARDTSNNYGTSTSISVTVSNTGSVPQSVVATAALYGATITWTTASVASSRVSFGLTSSLGSTTPETDTVSRVTSHSVSLAGLPSCTRFYYVVAGATGAGDYASSTMSTFTTGGCTGNASVTTTQQDVITTSAGGTVSEGVLTLSVPASFTATTSAATFQVHKLEPTTFFASAGAPTGKARAGDTVFNLKALTDATTTLSTFSNPLTVTLSYAANDVLSVSESSLWIYRYDGNQWYPLQNCVVNSSARTVTCETQSFSDFSIFGDSVSTATRRSSGGFTLEARIAFLRTQGDASLIPQVEAQFASTSHSVSRSIFTATLRPGTSHVEVRALQQFLNSNGYMIASNGAGSPGNETSYFGVKTELAVKRYQAAHAQHVLAPAGLSRPTGIVGPLTRALLNAGS